MFLRKCHSRLHECQDIIVTVISLANLLVCQRNSRHWLASQNDVVYLVSASEDECISRSTFSHTSANICMR